MHDRQTLPVAIKAIESAHTAWTQPVDVYFRRDGSGWKLVGVERVK